MRKKRLKRNKQQAMNRRKKSGKKPMSVEQKETAKKLREEDRLRTLADLTKKRAKKKE